jgi:hypothetical protein
MPNHNLRILSPLKIAGSSGPTPPFAQGSAVEYNGIDSYNENSTSCSVPGDTAVSIAWWTKLQAADAVLMNRRGTIADGWAITYFPSFGGLNFQIIDNVGGEIRVSFGNVPSLSNWVFLVITLDGTGNASGMNAYINGSLATRVVQTDTSPNYPVPQTDPFVLGADSLGGTPSNPSSARISWFACYSDELSASEVSDLYNSGTPVDIRTQSWFNSSLLDDYFLPGNITGDSSSLLTNIGLGNNLTGFNSPTIVTDSP